MRRVHYSSSRSKHETTRTTVQPIQTNHLLQQWNTYSSHIHANATIKQVQDYVDSLLEHSTLYPLEELKLLVLFCFFLDVFLNVVVAMFTCMLCAV